MERYKLNIAVIGILGMTLFSAIARGQAPAMASHEEAEKWADQTLSLMPLEKKIGQLICAEIAGGYIAADDPRLQQWDRLARNTGVGMFVLYGGTPRDVAYLLNRLQKEAALPILMAADFEGGPGQQVAGASEFPANEVKVQEFRAFKEAVETGVTFIMTEHIGAPR